MSQLLQSHNEENNPDISSVCKAVQNCKNKTYLQLTYSKYKTYLQFCTALHTLLMMTAEFMLSNPDISFTLLLDSLSFI